MTVRLVRRHEETLRPRATSGKLWDKIEAARIELVSPSCWVCRARPGVFTGLFTTTVPFPAQLQLDLLR